MLGRDGDLTVAVAWCDQAPDSVVVYHRSGGELLDQARISGPALQGEKIGFVDLEELPKGWSVTEGDLDLREDRFYEIRAYKTGVQLTYGGVTLRAGHKKDLYRDGIVIQYYDDSSEYGYDVKLNQDGLRNKAEEMC
ncbi:hypothetical protein [Nonomuraea jiangxiensis]|uniref:Uncharacterized protein n=1 Tax=Nonomuraea jiangxiensis TaxID=633440 RepID=A0A1G9Q5J3_9ACTN|nr:hypothetical protein [Nonomuraea jiangxiensis]SDM06314.1 hypothetical protein SAMN05421869_13560 [Nonomuraea jiangxiensis]